MSHIQTILAVALIVAGGAIILLTRRISRLRAEIAKFDHDGDGRPGGSRKKPR